jgi:hypothetical protein
MMTGIDTDWPMIVVAIDLSFESPATWGAKPSSSKEARLSFEERPFSEPATKAP